MKSALLLIDLQNDFCPGGALAVQNGDETIAIANQAIAFCEANNIAVIASQDWHPRDHGSFATTSGHPPWTIGELNGLPQVWWPSHCIQHQQGAEFHPKLNTKTISFIVYKGQNAHIDSYSAFYDNGHKAATELNNWLSQHNIKQLTIMGLATDYCVKFSVLDALTLGYQVTLLTDGCRGVELSAGDNQRAIEDMRLAGAKQQTLAEWISAQSQN